MNYGKCDYMRCMEIEAETVTGYGGGLSKVVYSPWLGDYRVSMDRIARIRDVSTGGTLKEREWAHKTRLKRHATAQRKGGKR